MRIFHKDAVDGIIQEASPTVKRSFPYVCDTCGKGVWKKSDLQGHMAHKHNATKHHKCLLCSEEFGYKNMLRNHMRIFHKDADDKMHKASSTDKQLYPYVCDTCGKGVWKKSDLEGHMAHKHNATKQHKCLLCSEEFGYKNMLRNHMRIFHKDADDKMHTASSSDKQLYPFVCDTCGKGVWKKCDLEGHMAHKHNAIKQHKCFVCSEEFGYKHRLLHHMRVLHKATVDDK